MSLRCFTFSEDAPKNVGVVRRLLWFVTSPGVFQYIAHLERLRGLRITLFDYVPMADDLTVEAVYKGQALTVNMMWGGDLTLFADPDVPASVFEEVCQHMKSYRRVGGIATIRASNRYRRIAKGKV